MTIKAILYYDSTELELLVLKKSSLTIIKEVEREFGHFYMNDLSLVCSNISDALTTAFSGKGPWQLKLYKDDMFKFGGWVDEKSVVFDYRAYTVAFNTFGYLRELREVNAEGVAKSIWTIAQMMAASARDWHFQIISWDYHIVPGDRLRIEKYKADGEETEEDTTEEVIVTKVTKKSGYPWQRVVIDIWGPLQFSHPLFTVVTNLSLWHRDIMIHKLVGLLLKKANFSHSIIDVPESVELDVETLSPLSIGPAEGFPRSLVRKDVGSLSLVTSDGTYEGDFEGGFTKVSGDFFKQADWIEQTPITGDYPTELLGKSSEIGGSAYVYDYRESPYCRFRIQIWVQNGSIYRNDWSGSSWGGDVALNTESKVMYESMTLDAHRRYLYYGLSENEIMYLRRYDIAGDSFSSSSGRIMPRSDEKYGGGNKYLKGPDIIVCDYAYVMGSAYKKVRIFSGSNMSLKATVSVPKGLDVPSLIALNGKIYGLIKTHRADDPSQDVIETSLFISDYNLMDQSTEIICYGGKENQMTLWLNTAIGFAQFSFFKVSIHHALTIKEADFTGMTVADALVALAQMSNCVLTIAPNRIAFFVKRAYYKNSLIPDIGPAIIGKKEIKEWRNVFDFINLSYQQGEVVYPEEIFAGQSLSVDCPFVYYESYAKALARSLYEFFAQPRRLLKATLAQSALPSLSSSSSSFSSSSFSSSSSSFSSSSSGP